MCRTLARENAIYARLAGVFRSAAKVSGVAKSRQVKLRNKSVAPSMPISRSEIGGRVTASVHMTENKKARHEAGLIDDCDHRGIDDVAS